MITACRRGLVLIEAVGVMLTILVVAVDIAVPNLTARHSRRPIICHLRSVLLVQLAA